MGKILISNQSAHWYDRDGNPRYGSGLREARKENLVPSVTTIMNVIDKYQIGVWKQEQAILSVLDAIRRYKESDSEFDYNDIEFNENNDVLLNVIRSELDCRLSKAATVGTKVHSAIESYLILRGLKDGSDKEKNAGDVIETINEVLCFFDPAKKWIDNHICDGDLEKSFSNNCLGFAGRIDYDGALKNMSWFDSEIGDEPFDAIVDFKTQNVKNGKPKFWDEMVYQLAAYRKKDSKTEDFVEMEDGKRLVTVIISTNPDFPGATAKVWPEFPTKKAGLSAKEGWEIFKAARDLFFKIKNL